MKLKIRNCVTDPEKKALRSKGQGVLKPLFMGSVLVPGAIRIVEAKAMSKDDVDTLDFLVKSHSCTALHIGVGMLDSCEAIYAFLGFAQEESVQAVEVKEFTEVVVEESAAPAEPEVIEETSEELVDEAATSAYTEEDLMNMKNADLRDICQLVNQDTDVSGLTKKKLVAFILEHQ